MAVTATVAPEHPAVADTWTHPAHQALADTWTAPRAAPLQ